MAPVTRLYNHTARKVASQDIDFDNLRIMLLSGDAVFDATHTTLLEVADVAYANEVHGNGWTEGGEFLANVVAATITTDDAMIDADDPVVVATGGAIGPASFAVIYDDTDADGGPLAFLDFDGAITAGEGTEFKIIFSATGFITLNYTQPG